MPAFVFINMINAIPKSNNDKMQYSRKIILKILHYFIAWTILGFFTGITTKRVRNVLRMSPVISNRIYTKSSNSRHLIGSQTIIPLEERMVPVYSALDRFQISADSVILKSVADSWHTPLSLNHSHVIKKLRLNENRFTINLHSGRRSSLQSPQLL